MSELKKEISKNIQIVFDNEESFLEEFTSREIVQIDGIYAFYMGSAHHLIIYEFEGIEVCHNVASSNDFDLWKSKLESKEV